jgi:hypothetical protein
VGYYNVILKTTDGGDNWSYQTSGINTWWHGVSFTDENNGTAVADFGTIIRTTDGGQNWVLQTSGTNTFLEDVCFTDALIGTAVGDSGTIIRTTNGGIPVELLSFAAEVINDEVVLKWQTATETNNSGFEVERSKKIEARTQNDWTKIGFVEGKGTTTEKTDYIFEDRVSTPGVYSYRLKQIDFDGSFEYSLVVEVDFKSLASYLLEQNYPNPFNPSTVISYQLPVSSDLVLKVFDVLGNEIATLVNEEKPAGEYEVEFDAARLTSGIYFYQLRAGDFTQVKKMILLR